MGSYRDRRESLRSGIMLVGEIKGISWDIWGDKFSLTQIKRYNYKKIYISIKEGRK